METYGAVSLILFLLSAAAWMEAWRQTSPILPQDQWASRVAPGVTRVAWVVRRYARIAALLGALNLVIALIIMDVTR